MIAQGDWAGTARKSTGARTRRFTWNYLRSRRGLDLGFVQTAQQYVCPAGHEIATLVRIGDTRGQSQGLVGAALAPIVDAGDDLARCGVPEFGHQSHATGALYIL